MNLPLAPYGNIVEPLIKLNPISSIYIYCGKDAFADARASIKNAIPCLCLPFLKQPHDYRWPVSEGSFILFDTGGVQLEFLTQFTIFLLHQGANKIVLCTELAPIQIFTQKDLA